MAQTTDGYLWIGTQAGLMRFDGVRFVAWKPPQGYVLPSSRINSLLGARDGSLWIGTTLGLARWQNGNLTRYTDPPGSIMAILEDRAGTIWIARANISDAKGPLCKVTGPGLQCYGRDDGLVLPYAVTLANDSVGNLWLAGSAMVSRLQSKSFDTYVPAGLNPAEIRNGVLALARGPDGSVWVGLVNAGKGGGLQQLAQGTWRPFITSEFDSSTLRVTRLLVDRSGSLWIGTLDQGIYRIQGNQVDHFRSSDGLSGDAVSDFFQDREGNIWIATSSGIDNFHDLRVASFSTRQGLSAAQVNAVVASRDGTVWIGNSNLDALRLGKITSIQPRNGLPGRELTSLLEDGAGRLWVGVDSELWVYERAKFRKIKTRDGNPLGVIRAMTEDVDGSIWAETYSNENRSRLHHIQDLRHSEEISIPQLPLANTLAADPHGGVWLGLASGGLARYRDGKMEFISLNQSPHDGPVHGLLVSSDGSVLAATTSGLVGWQNGRVQSLTVRNGLPCEVVYSLIADKNATLWLYADCGLVAIPRAELEAWWQAPETIVKPRLLDVFDGAQPMSTPFRPNVSLSPDGRLWFANQNVVQMIDPAHLDGNPTQPPVHIEEVSADRKTYLLRDGLRLPALTRDLRIDYTALSFVAPQKVRFRYMLEGHDTEWQDAGTRRQAFYTDLRPGNYRFRVIASNNDGVWNEEGATLAFIVAAAWYQTWWFRGVSLAAFLALLWALYRWRIQQVQRQERQLRDVIDTMPALAFSTTADGKNEWVNRRWVEYSGLSQEASSGSGWRSTVHPDDLDEHEKKWQRSVASGEPFENEVRRRGANGEYRWFLVRGVPLRDEHGRILKWYGTLTDIEDRKHAEEELRRSQAYLAEAQRVSRTGSFGWRVSSGEILWSAETFRIFQYLPLTKPSVELVLQRTHPEDAVWLKETLQCAAKDGKDLDLEHRLLLPDGSVKHVHVVGHLQRDKAGELEYVGAVMDMTATRQGEQALRQAEADLAHVSRVTTMGELVASIAHEVNQPLGAIVTNGSACLRLLARETPDLDKSREVIGRMINDGLRASEVIKRIRDLLHKAAPEKAPLNINETIQEVIALVSSDVVRSKVELRAELAVDLPLVLGDRIQLQQVILNLIINGRDAMSDVQSHSRELLITSLKSKPGEVMVAVRDSGTGLDPKDAARIFDPFFTTKAEGMGLGLSISRRIIEDHGGTLWATPNEDRGATMQFTLPPSKR